MPHRPHPPNAVELHGWDPTSASWHGPDELQYSVSGCRGLASKLREAGGTWYGLMRTQVPRGPSLSLWATARDMDDAGLATLDMDGSTGGPLQTTLIVPAQRRDRVRADLPFEFVSYLRFLEGPVTTGSEMAIHDYIERTLQQSGHDRTLVFSVESRLALDETRIALCEATDRLVSCMVAWMAERDSSRMDAAAFA
jgi:hypothetical protein